MSTMKYPRSSRNPLAVVLPAPERPESTRKPISLTIPAA